MKKIDVFTGPNSKPQSTHLIDHIQTHASTSLVNVRMVQSITKANAR